MKSCLDKLTSYVPVDLQSTGGVTAGLRPAWSLVHFFFA